MPAEMVGSRLGQPAHRQEGGKGDNPVVGPLDHHRGCTAILWPLKGHHDEFVFTYIAQRNRDDERVKGERYPITLSPPRDAMEAPAQAGAGEHGPTVS